MITFDSAHWAPDERGSLNLPFIPHMHYNTLEKYWPCSFQEVYNVKCLAHKA